MKPTKAELIERHKQRITMNLSRPILIHVCKDGTISYRTRKQKVFNGRALPICSVETEKDAQSLQIRFGSRQWTEHPQMRGKIWYRLSVLPDGMPLCLRGNSLLEIEDLDGIGAMFESFVRDRLERIKAMPEEQA